MQQPSRETIQKVQNIGAQIRLRKLEHNGGCKQQHISVQYASEGDYGTRSNRHVILNQRILEVLLRIHRRLARHLRSDLVDSEMKPRR